MGGGGGNMANPPPFHVTDFFSNSPALSLSLAGTFRHREPAAEKVVDLGKGNRNGWLREEAVEIISSETENSAPSRTRTEDEDEDEDELLDDKTNNKRRKKYHRHTADQIKQMEL